MSRCAGFADIILACMRFRGRGRDDFTFGDVSETNGRRRGGRGGGVGK